MRTFKAKVCSPQAIIVATPDDLSALYGLISKDEDFIVEWMENGVKNSQVIVGTLISSKVKMGEIVLRSEG